MNGISASTDDNLDDPSPLPAVGIVATGSNTGSVVRTILRAEEHGYDSLVTYSGDRDTESVRFARKLGATVVDPTNGKAGEQIPRESLVEAARRRSYPGLIFQNEDCDRIDFVASEQIMESGSYCVDAVSEIRDAEPGTKTIVGIPAYNEAETISDVVTSVKPNADTVLVVDDGSDDETVERARQAGAEVIQHRTNRGYGKALQTLFEESANRGVEYLVTFDGDGQHNPEDIPNLLSAHEKQRADIVIGSRFVNTGETDAPLYRRFGVYTVNFLTNLSLGVLRPSSWIKDTQSGFRSYSAPAIQSLAENTSISERMGASTDILYHAHHYGYSVSEVGTSVSYDVEDTSHHGPVTHGYLLIKNILKTVETERPMTAIGLPGIVSLVFGVGFGYRTVTNYIATDTFPGGIALTATFFILFGTFTLFTSLILHSLNQHLD